MTKDIMTSGIEMSDVIKATGFPVPSDLEGKTFAECVSGGGGGDSGSASAYAWKSKKDGTIFLNVDKAPDSSSDAYKMKILYNDNGEYGIDTYLLGSETYTKLSDAQFEVLLRGRKVPDVFERVSEDDVIIWAGEGGGNTTAYTWHGYFEDATLHQETDIGILHFDFSSAPATQSDFMSGHTFDPDEYLKVVKNEEAFAWANITEYTVSEGAIHMTGEVGNYRFVRDSSKDLSIWEVSGNVTVEPLNVTENGTYTAPSGKAYSPVTVNVAGGGSGSWHNINDATISTVDNTLGVSARASGNAIVAFRMKISDDYVTGAIMGGDGDGGATVSACGMKIVDYWDKPANCFFDTGFDIGYTGELTWNNIATSILNAYNTSTSGSYTFTSFEVYY